MSVCSLSSPPAAPGQECTFLDEPRAQGCAVYPQGPSAKSTLCGVTL